MTRALVALVLVALPAFARPETPVAPVTSFRAVDLFTQPALATDGETWFAVWNDTRDGNDRATYGARLTPNGELLDPVGVRLTDGFGGTAVAYGDGRYFAVDAALEFAIVSRDAKVLVRGEVDEGASERVRVIFNGRDFVAFWGIDVVRVAVFDRDGRVVAEPRVLVPQASETRLHDVATNGDRIVVLYARGVDLYSASLTMSGAPVTADILVQRNVWPYVPAASVASVNGGFAAVWVPLESGPEAFGTLLDDHGRPVSEGKKIADGSGAKIIAADGAYRLLTGDVSGTHVRIVGRTLSADLTPGPALPLFARAPFSLGAFDAASGPGGVMTIAQVDDPNRTVAEEGLYAATDEAHAAPKLVSRAAVTQRDAAVVAGSDGTLVAWREEPHPRVRATFVANTGGTATLDLGETRLAPAVAAVGETYLVAWTDGEKAYARLVRHGAPVGETIVLGERTTMPVATGDGRDFVVAWTGYAGEVHAVRITTAGEIVAEWSIAVSSVVSLPVPALACDRGECLVAWRTEKATWLCPRFGCLRIDAEVLAVRLDARLEAIDAQPLVIASGTSYGTELAAAAHDGEYVVSWVRIPRVHVRTIARDGTLSPEHDFEGSVPSIARQGDSWLLARESSDEILVSRLSADGRVLSRDSVLFRDAQARRAPALAANGPEVLVAYERTTRDEAAGGVPRVYVSAIGESAPKRRAVRR